jgi:aminoglycoside phosphotransferase (APT) family kinase protein
MGRSPLILAALAKAAVPALNFSQVKPQSFNNDGHYDSALLTATNGDHYVIKMPSAPRFALDLDTEMVAIRSINADLRARLPFEITKQIGETKDERGNRAILLSYVYGNSVDLTRLHGTDPVLGSLAGALAAIHSLPLSVVENSGLPTYTPAELIRENVARLDRAAQTGMVPPALLSRWEEALEDVNLFRFNPCVVHGDFVGETVLEIDGAISGVLGWRSLRISDPALDLAWIVGAGNPDAAYTVLLEYSRLRGTSVDDNLKQRAALYSELNVADWLVYGLANNDQEVVDSALGQLQQYVADLEQGAAESITPRGLGQQSAGVLELDDFDIVSPAAGFEPAGFEPAGSTAFVPAAFMDNSQEVVNDSFFTPIPIDETPTAPIAMPVIAEEAQEPAAFEPAAESVAPVTQEILIAELIEEEVIEIDGPVAVPGDYYDHGKLFAETAPIDLPTDLPGFLSEDTASGSGADSAAKPAGKEGELF